MKVATCCQALEEQQQAAAEAEEAKLKARDINTQTDNARLSPNCGYRVWGL